MSVLGGDVRSIWPIRQERGRSSGLITFRWALQTASDRRDAGASDPHILIRGGSCIISPLGKVLAEPCFGDEAILTAPIDLAEIVEGKYDLDVVGHYARPDIFHLIVDERARMLVSAAVDTGEKNGRGD